MEGNQRDIMSDNWAIVFLFFAFIGFIDTIWTILKWIF